MPTGIIGDLKKRIEGLVHDWHSNDDEFFYGLGLEVFVYKRMLSILAEAYGAVGLKDSPTDSDKSPDLEELPFEAGGGLRFRAPCGLILTVGGSAGITDGWAMPDFRVFVGLGYTPPPKPKKRPKIRPKQDSDNDGISDGQDPAF